MLGADGLEASDMITDGLRCRRVIIGFAATEYAGIEGAAGEDAYASGLAQGQEAAKRRLFQ